MIKLVIFVNRKGLNVKGTIALQKKKNSQINMIGRCWSGITVL